MRYTLRIMLSVFLGAHALAMEIGTKITFSSPHYQSGKVFEGELATPLADLIGDKSPEQFQTVPAIAVYVACCKKDDSLSGWKNAYLVFMKTGPVFVHAAWIKK